MRIEQSNLRLQVCLLLLVDEVSLVEDDDVCELDLVHHELGDGAEDVVAEETLVVGLHAAEVVEELRGVYERDAGVQPRHLAQLQLVVVMAGVIAARPALVTL